MSTTDPGEGEQATPSPAATPLGWQTAAGRDGNGRPVATLTVQVAGGDYVTTWQVVLRPEAMERLAADLLTAARQARTGLVVAPASALPPAGNGQVARQGG